MRIKFTKMHGLGNDFMVLDQVSHSVPELTAAQIQKLADRHTGVGFDQLLIIKAPAKPDVDFDYRIFNSDGSEVEHCGNGARCFALYVREQGLCQRSTIKVQTINRKLTLRLQEDGEVTVDMGTPGIRPWDLPFKDDEIRNSYSRSIKTHGNSQTVKFSIVSMGNPHAVIMVDDIDTADVKDIGLALGTHPDFPAGVNVGFMQICSSKHIRLRVFERGAGETRACGTGACAAVVAGCHLGLLDDTVNVDLTGGRLKISWNRPHGSVLMTGPASKVYQGQFRL